MRYLLLILIIIPNSLFSYQSQRDSIVSNKLFELTDRLAETEKLVDSIAYDNYKLKSVNFKLNNELFKFRMQEKFFEEAFNFQYTQFIFTIVAVLLLAIIVIFYSFKYHTDRLNDKFGSQILEQKESFVGLTGKIEVLEYNMDVSLGNISSLISEFHLKNGNFYQGFKYSINGAKYLYKGTKLKVAKEKEIIQWEKGVSALLTIALEALNKIELNPTYVASFKEQQTELFELVNEVSKSDIDDISTPASLIKMKLREIVNS